jgi:hypothetical protein
MASVHRGPGRGRPGPRRSWGAPLHPGQDAARPDRRRRRPEGSDGTAVVEPGAAKGTVAVTIAGAAANAIGLWVDCADRRGDLVCRPNSGMAGQYSWDVRFVVGAGGAARRAAW